MPSTEFDVPFQQKMANREDVLGFIPQRESIYCRLLPYADELDEESNGHLAEIKENLAKSVQLRDTKIGTSHWTVQLTKYIQLYGMKFSKEDHLYFVHLMFQLATSPEMEYSLVQKYSGALCALLKKEELLSRDDLVLPWRPLYDLIEHTIYSSLEQHGLRLLPSNIDNTVKALVRKCRTYFSDESTQEMLEEWRPLLCPFDVTVIRGLSYLEMFLPTSLPPEKHHMGFKLWLQELLDMWYSFCNCPSWEGSLVNLFSRLANDTIGYIDWKPHMPMIFTRVLRSFNLPVGNKLVNYSRGNHCYDTNSVATWIVAMMGDGDSALQHIQKLFRALHSFLHPSNSGRWSLKLSSFLQTMPFLVVKRLCRERYKKPSWVTPVPDSHKLQNEEITQFVETLKPEVFTAMFGKWASQDSAIRNLASLRAEIIVPPLLEKMYPAMETLIEPHRLISCMFCIVGAARPMLSCSKYYPDGPNHVIPLLQLALPGIDSNDFKKTLVTLQMISTFTALIPIVDCSEAPQVRSDLTEQEAELCSATAQFEDFILEFLNRIMSIIENSTQEAASGAVDRLTPEQNMLEMGLASTVTSVLQQCSKPIFMSALNKVNRFIMENVFEPKVGGRLASSLCRACARVRPEETLKLLLPPLCAKINNFAVEHTGFATEEHLDNSFLWNILMVSQLMRCNGSHLLPYRVILLETLGPVLSLHSQQGYEIGGQVLRFMLRAMSFTYPVDFRSVTAGIDQPLTDFLPIREWATAGDIDNLNLQWYTPTEENIEFVTTLAKTVLAPELEFIRGLTSSSEVSKEDLQRRLHIILEFIQGAGALLPAWKGDSVPLRECQVSLHRFCCIAKKVKEEVTLDGNNVRLAIAEAMRHLLRYLMESREDDTQSMFKVIQIYDSVMMFLGIQKSDVEARFKSFRVVRAALENKLATKKKHIRPLLVDRVTLLQEVRMLCAFPRVVTTMHMDLMSDLLDLSVSRYREVRKRAQNALHHCFTFYHYIYHQFIPNIVAHLKNPQVEEHTFKGALHLILGSGNKRTLAIRRSWPTLAALWPAIAQSQQFEKPSILRIVDDIITKVVKAQETIVIKLSVSPECLETSRKMLESTSAPRPSGPPLTEQQLAQGRQAEQDRDKENLRLYHQVVADLTGLVESGKLTWKFTQNAMEFLGLLLRDDVDIPTPVVSLFTKHCVNDLLYIRKLALTCLSTILKQQKRPKKKVPVDIAAVCGTEPSLPTGPLAPGDREDNMWHQYNAEALPITKEQWDAATFVPKTHLGYYCWPMTLLKYADASQQPKLLRGPEEMPDNEQPIAESFCDMDYVLKLLDFLALEEQKGKDKFQLKHLTLFKGLFRNFGDSCLEVFKPHLERLVRDTSHDKHDSSQRCAMEVLAGLIRGSKHWPFEKIKEMWDWLLPLLTFIRNNITIETQDDWGTFFSTLSESRDPRQLHWMFELLLDSPINGEAGAFGDASRLLMLQQGLIQQEWRVPQIMHRILTDVTPHLGHHYKAVRDQLGSLLSNIFLYDYRLNTRSQSRSPQRSQFLEQLLTHLQPLKDAQLDRGDTNNATVTKASQDRELSGSDSSVDNATMQVDEDDSEDEEKRIIRVCKTVLKWLNHSCVRGFNTLTEDVFPLLPVICNLSSVMNDEDLRTDCKATLTNLSSCLLTPDILPTALNTIKEVAGLESWHARVAILHFVQIAVFGNFFLLQNQESQTAIRELLLHLLCDERLEVREVAAMTLSGLMHCGFLQMNSDMLSHFEHLRRVKLKKRQASTEPDSLEKLIKRHAGVLGLSACVQAHPYDVPDFIPQVLMDLSIHVNDPQPIQMTVKKTLSDFRRTHHDNWHDHKQMFTDDQLVVLTDLLISPNYYA
ncbi:proteasome activator complex subunit 4B-like [Babylonia areolata]|uniref:proteasome activator complex subunit 4B-like n=1 Tax=Babylonia areolata TaxID=304850 RepID=UPI003FD3F45F